MKRLMLLVLCAAAMMGCSSKLKKENEALREEIEERREALEEHQQRSLKEAKHDLAQTDSLLEAAQGQYDELHSWVMEHAQQVNDHSPEVERLNALHARCDSLKERFEVLAQTIKYIRKKQKE